MPADSNASIVRTRSGVPITTWSRAITPFGWSGVGRAAGGCPSATGRSEIARAPRRGDAPTPPLRPPLRLRGLGHAVRAARGPRPDALAESAQLVADATDPRRAVGDDKTQIV